MSEILIKAENEDDNNSNSNSSLCDLTALLQEVKKEEQKSLSDDDETQAENNKGETLPESFFDDLYRDEIEAAPIEATTDADIQKLQEIIAKKKRILHEDDELPGHNGPGRSRSQSPVDTRKRKEHGRNDGNQNKESQAKRARKTIDTPPEDFSTQTESPTPDNQQPPSPTNDCPPSKSDQDADPELELENLLKTEDYNSDEEPANSRQGIAMNNNMQPMYGFPNAMPMYNPATNQMMGPNMTPGGYPMMCNMGFPQGFYQPTMMNMQMMNYGLPQMNIPQTNEVECLPVVSGHTGLPKIPFKKIKLEKAAKIAVAPAEDPKRKIIDACVELLEKMEFAESTGKFVYTSTITKDNNAATSNSILQKITNVSYNFQSIGPKQNLEDWGLQGIPNANADIAKKISMSADKYFNKIAQNANTTARKLVKEEVTKADKKNQREEEMEYEEVTLSSYFKNSMTQTDALVCRECVARKRKVGHSIAVQATAFTGSIGTQTTPEVRFNEQLTQGLSENQLKAMYEFSLLIREPPKNTSVELIRLRDQLMNMYNLSQRVHKGIVPFIDASSAGIGSGQSPVRDPRNENRSISDPRRFANATSQNQMAYQPPVQMPQQNIPNYPQHTMQIPNQQIPSSQYPARPQDRANAQHPMQIPNQHIPPTQYPVRPQDRANPQHAMQIPNQQIPPTQYPVRPQDRGMQIPAVHNQQRNVAHPEIGAQYPNHFVQQPGNEFAQQVARKTYGRGGLRR